MRAAKCTEGRRTHGSPWPASESQSDGGAPARPIPAPFPKARVPPLDAEAFLRGPEEGKEAFPGANCMSGATLSLLRPDPARVDREGLEYSDLSPLTRVNAGRLVLQHPVRCEHRGFSAVVVRKRKKRADAIYCLSVCSTWHTVSYRRLCKNIQDTFFNEKRFFFLSFLFFFFFLPFSFFLFFSFLFFLLSFFSFLICDIRKYETKKTFTTMREEEEERSICFHAAMYCNYQYK